MKLTWYKTDTETNKFNKELEYIAETEIKFLSAVDVVNPKLVLSEIPTGANYCHIDALNRYYFIESKNVLDNGRIVLSLSCDVLYTYQGQILESECEIVEADSPLNLNRSIYEGELIDTVSEIDFDNPFTGRSEVLITAQGEQ